MSESIIKTKSFELAIIGVRFFNLLITDKKEFVMSKQFLRSITSIGANVREAINAQSRADLFINFQFHKKNAMKRCIG
ncbi:MAG: four helix bundle protein [Flavobacterium sp.]